MDNKISVIVPVYNCERYLPKCVESILAQTHTELEVILVNDGSKDSSGDICDSYSKRDQRVRVIHQVNGGVSSARNTGVKEASGTYIMFVDADDWIESETCAMTLRRAYDTGAQIVLFGYYRDYHDKSLSTNIFNRDIVFEKEEVKDLQRKVVGLVKEELKAPHKFDNLSPVYMRLILRSFILSNGIEFIDSKNMIPGEDTVYNLLLFTFAEKVAYLNKSLYHYRREDHESATLRINQDYFDKWLPYHLQVSQRIQKQTHRQVSSGCF